MKISNTIKEIREAKRISQASIAESLGMDRANYNKLEKRDVKMTVEQLLSIAQALDVSVYELVGGKVPELVEVESNLATIKEANKLMEELYKLRDKEQKRQIENLTWTQSKHEIAFQLALEEIESTYGVDLFEYKNQDPETIQREVWFQPFIEKYRILLITVISTGLLNTFNQTLLKCLLDAMKPLSYGESMLFDRFDRIALLDKGIQAFNALYPHAEPDPISEQKTLSK